MKHFFLLCTLLVLLGGCGKDDDPKPEPQPNPDTPSTQTSISITPSALTFDEQGSEKAVTVTCTSGIAWSLSGGESWCKVSKTTGFNETTVTFTAEANTSPDERKATYTFNCGDKTAQLVVRQIGEQPSIVIIQNRYEVSAKGETIKVKINSNVDYTISIPSEYASWIQEVNEPKELSSDTKYFSVLPNSELQSRIGEILFISKEQNLVEKVTIKQRSPSDPDYTTVHIPTKGTLASVLAENNIETSSIVLLKITGEINDVDILEIRGMANLRNLDISETNLMELPAHSLAELKNLETVILPNTLTSIGKRAFYNSGLQSVEIPASVETIQEKAFSGCDFTSIEIPVSVKIIERGAFAYCTALTSVTFKKNSRLKTIEGSFGDSHIYDFGAFSGCTSLTSIEIPASVETIGYAAFKGCTALTDLTFEKGSQLKTIKGMVDNYYWYKYYGTFSDCTSLTSIEIPASVETIEPTAFENCTALTTVTFEKGSQLKTIKSVSNGIDDYGGFSDLPSLKTVDMSTCTLVEKIDLNAFEGCYDIQLVKIGTATPPDAYGAFDIDRFSILKVPSESVEAYKNADGWKEFPSISALD